MIFFFCFCILAIIRDRRGQNRKCPGYESIGNVFKKLRNIKWRMCTDRMNRAPPSCIFCTSDFLDRIALERSTKSQDCIFQRNRRPWSISISIVARYHSRHCHFIEGNILSRTGISAILNDSTCTIWRLLDKQSTLGTTRFVDFISFLSNTLLIRFCGNYVACCDSLFVVVHNCYIFYRCVYPSTMEKI